MPGTLLIAAALLISACGGDDSGAAGGGGEGSSVQATANDSPGGTEDSRGDSGEREELKQKARDRDPKGSGGESSPAVAIRAAVSGFFTSADPAVVCEEVITTSFLKQAFGDRRGCADAQSAGSAARDVDVSAVQDRGESAEAVAVPKGGPNDGERLEVSLVLDGGGWRIDGIASNVPVGP